MEGMIRIALAKCPSGILILQGRPCSSVNWGAWAGSGMAAKAGIERMARLGFGAIEPQAGMAAISSILAGQPAPQLLGSVFFWDR